MTKLRQIEISGFRGARHSLQIDFEKSCRSMAIFGHNAAGKSTITDAVEWFFNDRIDHLWREDCKEASLRNVHLTDVESASVQLKFSDDGLSCTKSLDTNLKVQSNASPAFIEYKAKSSTERIVLRTYDLSGFINKSKGEKRAEVAQLVGYEALVAFREVIQKTESSLEKDVDYIHAKQGLGDLKVKIAKLSGQLITNSSELYQTATAIARPFLRSVTISDNDSYQACITALTNTITNKDAAKQQQKLTNLKHNCQSIIKAIQGTNHNAKTFLKAYGELVGDKDKIKFINLEGFLSKGKELLDKGIVDSDKCPFCEKPGDLTDIGQEVAKRIEQLKELRAMFETTTKLKVEWISCMTTAVQLLDGFQELADGLVVDKELIDSVNNLSTKFKLRCQHVNSCFQQHQEVQGDPEQDTLMEEVKGGLQTKSTLLVEEIAALDLPEEQQNLITAIQTLTDLKNAFGEYQQNVKTKDAFEKQIKTLGKIKDRFISVQATALQNVLDMMSEDIKHFYLELHPKENVDDIRLRIIGNEGVEFEYSFHGQKTYPPKKYLSESHLNSLGLALFLSSVKLFNKENKFLVLDDVVTSFDSDHRLRLLRLLKSEFAHWQILLLTHQGQWFKYIRKELGSHGWLLREVEWTEENGIRIKSTPQSMRELIQVKRAQGHSVENDVRILLEEVLKEINSSIEVKMAFKFNDRNEERMAGELLSDLRGTLKKKSANLANDPVFKQLETSNLVGSLGSHDSPKEISTGDIDVVLEDIQQLETLFRCGGECKQLLSRASYSEVHGQLSCKCGALTMPWKD